MTKLSTLRIMEQSFDWWGTVASPIVFTLVGALISLYAAIVFERYKRYVDIVREVRSKRLTLGSQFVPVYVEGLREAFRMGAEYREFLELKQGQLEAEGQLETARRVGELHAFAYEATERVLAMQNMLDMQPAKKQAIETLLLRFQIRFAEIASDRFTNFEASFHPLVSALIRPWPQRLVAQSALAVATQFFVDLPSAKSL